MYAEGFKPSPWGATVYTHLGQGINVLRDLPKSPLKRGTLNPAPPFLRGVGGDQTQLRLDQKTCVYTVAQRARGARKAFKVPLPRATVYTQVS